VGWAMHQCVDTNKGTKFGGQELLRCHGCGQTTGRKHKASVAHDERGEEDNAKSSSIAHKVTARVKTWATPMQIFGRACPLLLGACISRTSALAGLWL
jgi:hypothetical protein